MNKRSLCKELALCSVSALVLTFSGAAYANPEGGQVVGGAATIIAGDKKLDIHQQTDRAIIDWRRFNIEVDEHTQFHQPSSSAMTLNRVNSPDPSRIMGKLSANGNVVLVNPNGVFFGKDARVDVNGLIATTADIANPDFMAGKLKFHKPGKPDGVILNEGLITAREAGLVALVAPNVANSGIIEAKLGRVELASGDSATVDLYGDGLYELQVSDKVAAQLVSNTGSIAAEGGTIAITAAAGKEVVNSLIAIEGELKAPAITQKGGKIIIAAAGSNKTSKKGGSNVALSQAHLDVSGRKQGQRGGEVTITGDQVALLEGTLIDASGHTGKTGTTAGKNISDAREGAAGGDIKIGGDYLGLGSTPTAENLYVDAGAVILNDALHVGDAGRSIFWSDNTTKFFGNVLARAHVGDGGFVETSGHKHLDAQGFVDLTAKNGQRGTYFLDPTNITIFGTSSSALGPGVNFVSSAGASVSVNLSNNLELWLDANDASTINCGGTCSNGSSVQGWTDKSTLTATNSAAQSSAGNRPTYNSSDAGFNSRPTIEFGSDQWMDGAADIDRTQGITLFVTAERIAASGFSFMLGGGAGTRLGLRDNQINGGGAFDVGNTAGSIRSLYPGNVIDAFRYSGGTVYERTANGTSIISNTTSTVAPLAVNYDVGTLDNRTDIEYNSGGIAEIMVFNRALSVNERDLLLQYQSAKWGIALDPVSGSATEVAEATGSTGYSVFSTRYLERLSTSANISLQATNDISLDLQGDTLNFSTAGRTLTLNAGNQITTASAGTITTNNAAINLTGTNGILVSHALALNSGGGNITFNNALTLGGNLTTNSGSGTTTFSAAVNGANNLTATAGTFSFAQPLGGATALGAVNLTSANAFNLPSISASSITASTTTGNMAGAGGLVTSGGNVNLTAGTDLDLSAMGIVTNNGNATLGGRDVTLNTWVNTGTGNFTVNASRDIFLTRNNLTSGLVGRWEFDEGSGTTATDSSGNGNTGTLTNGPTWSSSDPYGLSGNGSLSFDGVDDFVSSGAVNIPSSSPISLAAWVNFQPGGGTYDYIIQASDWNGSDLFSIARNATSDEVYYVQGGALRLGPALPSGAWMHVAMVFDTPTSVRFYLNGTERSIAQPSAAMNTGAAEVTIGKFALNLHHLNGLLNDVRIYNTALTATQVSQLYAPQVAWNTGTTSLNAGRDVAFNLGGDTLNIASDRNMSVAATGAISSSSAGTISTTRSGTGGNITMTTGGTSTLNVSNVTLNANSGGAVSLTSAGNLTMGAMNAGSILGRTTGAGADITLGGNLSGSAAGTAITLASADDFSNAGNYTLTTGGAGGRWLIYSDRPADNNLGGLTGAFNRYTCAYGGSCPTFASETGNGLLYSYTPTLTITPSAISALTFGDAAPSLSGYAYATSGYLGSDATADSITGSLTGSTSYTAGSAVGNYNISHSSGALSSVLGYGFSYANNATAIPVNARPITLRANNQTQTYGFGSLGTSAFTLTSGSLFGANAISGVTLATNATTSTSGHFNYSATPWTITPSAAVFSNGLASNYNITYSNAPTGLTINRSGLSVTGLTASNRAYDATNVATLAGTATISPVGTDVVTLGGTASASFADAAAGNTKAVTVSGYSISGTDANNYTFSQPTGLTANITKADLTITADNATRLQGVTNPTFTGVISGFVAGETLGTSGVTGDASYSSVADNTSPAGSYAIVAALGTLAATNYNFATFVDGILTVTAAPSGGGGGGGGFFPPVVSPPPVVEVPTQPTLPVTPPAPPAAPEEPALVPEEVPSTVIRAAQGFFSNVSRFFNQPATAIVAGASPVSGGGTAAENTPVGTQTTAQSGSSTSEGGEEAEVQSQPQSRLKKALQGLVEIHPQIQQLFGLSSG